MSETSLVIIPHQTQICQMDRVGLVSLTTLLALTLGALMFDGLHLSLVFGKHLALLEELVFKFLVSILEHHDLFVSQGEV